MNINVTLILSRRIMLLGVALAVVTSVVAAEPVRLGEALQLMADRSIIDTLRNAALRQGIPIPRETSITMDKPWDGDIVDISSIFYQNGLYSMFYEGHNPASTGERADSIYVCLAVSKDGIVWEKPTLGIVNFNGSKANNMVGFSDGKPLPWCFIFYDPRPDISADERVKAIEMTDRPAGDKEKGPLPVLLGSADGKVWHELKLKTELKSSWPNAFDGASVFWSPVEKAFVGYFRWWDPAPGATPRPLNDWMLNDGHPGVRSVFRSISTDLVSWSKPQPMGYGDTPREHIYEACTIPYYRSPGLYITLANRFCPGRRSLTLEEERALAIGRLDAPHNKNMPFSTFASDANDIVLMISKPGRAEFDRPFMEAFMRPGLELGNWASRCNYPSQNGCIVPTSPTELSFYVSRDNMQKTNHIQRMSLRTDGFASVNAPYAGGEMTTVPFTYSGDHLELNFSTSAAGEIRVELQDAAGNPLEGYSLADCDVLIGDRIAKTVSWHGQQSLSAYDGKPVRLHFQMKDADLYSFQFPGPKNR